MTGPKTAPAARIAAFAVGFFAITSLTIGWSRYGGGLALVWFGSAVAAVMLIGLPRALWTRALLAIMGASALATSLFGFGPHMAAPLALINAFEAWLIARLLLAARPRRDWLDNGAGLATLVAVCGVIGPGVAAVIGGFAATFAAPGPWDYHMAQWWAAHGLGTLIGFPMVYLAAGGGCRKLVPGWASRRGWELAGHLLLIAVTAVFSLAQAGIPLLFLPIVPLLLASFRCGREGATFGTLVIAGAGMWSYLEPTSLIGSMAISSIERVLFLQFYLATLSLLALPVSVALRKHQLLLAELKERKAMERLVADQSDDALLTLDEHGLIRYASPAGVRLTGDDALEGQGLGRFFDPLDEPLVRAALVEAAAAPGETCVIERPVLCGDDQAWLQAKIRAIVPDPAAGIRAGALPAYAVTIRDVSARKRTELEAIEASETDPLTGLPNRRALIDQLELALARAGQRPFALAILDLDHFKAINDTHGHIVGDAVLREVAVVMRRLTSPRSYFARLGGEEFALIARAGAFAEAERLCERLRRDIAQLLFTAPDRTRFSPTASIGLARITEAMSAAQALQAADTLLYAAKNSGRNRVRIAPLPRLARSNAQRAA